MSQTIYFGYGSNLWLRQMRLRCPDSQHLGIGRLRGWRPQINQRGYCNVVQRGHDTQSSRNESPDTQWEVYGTVYSLSAEDEAKLDINEGVPVAYTKEIIPIEFWPANDQNGFADISETPQIKDMLVYVDRVKISDSTPQTEYIFRMNRGIEDATKCGIPDTYFKLALRRFIPVDGDVVLSSKDREDAERQARDFKDE